MKSLHKNKHLCLSFIVSTITCGLALAQCHAIETPSAANQPISSESRSSNKVDNLDAVIPSVLSQIPELTIYRDMAQAVQDIHGAEAGIGIAPDGTFGRGAGPSPAFTNLLDQLDKLRNPIPNIQDKTYSEIITLAASDPSYNTDPDFKSAVDQAFTEHNQGVVALRHDLSLIEPTLTNLDTKTDIELLADYNNLPAIKNNTYDDLLTSIQEAEAIKEAYSEGIVDQRILDRLAAEVCEKLIVFAKDVNPEFKDPVFSTREPETLKSASTAPVAPNAGDVGKGESSATVVSVAIIGVVSVSLILGLIIMVKQYFFSPLRRKR